MPTIADPNTAAMLVLAGLAYRGFYFRRIFEDQHERSVARAVDAGLHLNDVQAAIGKWRLVWGPATRDADDFDESAMYVAQREGTNRLVVAVRGTNPVSLTDWTRGDLDVARPVVWPFGDGTARTSGSTASGLNTLLALTEPPKSYMGEIVETVVFRVSQLVPEVIAGLVRRLPVGREGALDPLADRLRDLFDRWKRRLATEAAGAVAQEVIEGLRRVNAERTPTVTAWPSPPPDGSGRMLVDFLIRRAESGPIELIVAGHSKGGALAPALALWLAETRARWDPKGNARIGCYTFAGPTPGNGAFGRRVAEKLDGPSRRLINSDDIVSHAWDDEGLQSIPNLYDGALEWARPIIAAVESEVTGADDYEPVSMPTEAFQGLTLPGTPRLHDPAIQIPHQHLEAYLEYTGLLEKHVTTLMLLQG